MTARFVVQPLSNQHDRTQFTCGNARIDSYFRSTVSQDVKRRYGRCFVACDGAGGPVAGFYTLSAFSIPLTDVPVEIAAKLPRYPSVPAVLIGWLARSSDYAGLRLGEALLFDALKRIAALEIGCHAVLVDAIDAQAARFYQSFGFRSLDGRPTTLYLPVATIKALL